MPNDVRLKMEGLDEVMKALKGERGKLPKIQIGIFGDKDARSSSITYAQVSKLEAPLGKQKQLGNAEIGARHEYGDPSHNLPQRSFLRMPLIEKMKEELDKSEAFNKDVLRKVVRERKVKPWLELVAISGVKVVLDAFHTGGFGKWAPLKPATLAHKTTKQILVETQQLRDSISWRIK